MLTKQLLDTTRGRIVTLLQTKPLTIDELATELNLTPNAVRAQLMAMQRDGFVHRSGIRPGTTRPSHIFELTTEVENLLSRAYIPLLNQLVQTFANSLPTEQVESLLRRSGKASR